MTENEKNTIITLRSRGMGYGEIAERLAMSINTVKSFCRRYAGRTSGPKSACEHCGKAVEQIAGRKHKRFCCDKCRNRWWNSHLELVQRKAYHMVRCSRCHKDFAVYGNKAQAGRKYCSRECYFQERFGVKA